MNIKRGKAVAVLKEGLKRKREQDMPGDTSVEHGVARFDSLLPPALKDISPAAKGCELACTNPYLSYSHHGRVL